jgi:hypothetical protein
MFSIYGELREVHVIRGPEGGAKGCAFVKFVEREAALAAIENLNDTIPPVSQRDTYTTLISAWLLTWYLVHTAERHATSSGQVRRRQEAEGGPLAADADVPARRPHGRRPPHGRTSPAAADDVPLRPATAGHAAALRRRLPRPPGPSLRGRRATVRLPAGPRRPSRWWWRWLLSPGRTGAQALPAVRFRQPAQQVPHRGRVRRLGARRRVRLGPGRDAAGRGPAGSSRAAVLPRQRHPARAPARR